VKASKFAIVFGLISMSSLTTRASDKNKNVEVSEHQTIELLSDTAGNTLFVQDDGSATIVSSDGRIINLTKQDLDFLLVLQKNTHVEMKGHVVCAAKTVRGD